MKLSPSLVCTLRTFNRMDPATRSGMLPVRDGAAFGQKVLTTTPPQAHPAPTRAASLPDSLNSQEGEVLAPHREQAAAPLVPKGGRPLERELANPMDPKSLASEASDKIKKAEFDPYAFSPPKAPGMDLD
jgi:hypothetical protein